MIYRSFAIICRNVYTMAMHILFYKFKFVAGISTKQVKGLLFYRTLYICQAIIWRSHCTPHTVTSMEGGSGTGGIDVNIAMNTKNRREDLSPTSLVQPTSCLLIRPTSSSRRQVTSQIVMTLRLRPRFTNKVHNSDQIEPHANWSTPWQLQHCQNVGELLHSSIWSELWTLLVKLDLKHHAEILQNSTAHWSIMQIANEQSQQTKTSCMFMPYYISEQRPIITIKQSLMPVLHMAKTEPTSD